MPKVAHPFKAAQESLNDSLNSLFKYARDPEWRELPNYDQRVNKHIEYARIMFSRCLEHVMPKELIDDKKPEPQKINAAAKR